MRLEYGGDGRTVPPEDQVLHRPRRADAARPKNRDALPSLAANTVVGDSVHAPLAQLNAEPLRLCVISRRVDLFELALFVPQIVKLRARDRSVQNLEVQVLSRRLRRFEESRTVMLRLGDRRRLVPGRVVDAGR